VRGSTHHANHVASSLTTVPKNILPNSTSVAVRIELPVQGMRRVRLAAVADPLEGNAFLLIFSRDTLPAARLDRSRTCKVRFELPGQPLSIIADIEEVLDSRTLKMRAREAIQHEQLRNYFRVDVNTPVIASSLLPPELAGEGECWRMTGESLDVSGNGLLVTFPSSLGEHKKVRLDIVLPTPDLKVVQCIAQVVREQHKQDGLYHAAMTFDEISPEDRDRIIGCCLSIQRKHIRLRVRVRKP